MKKQILDEIDQRITNYSDFRHELTARVCIVELIGLWNWINDLKDIEPNESA